MIQYLFRSDCILCAHNSSCYFFSFFYSLVQLSFILLFFFCVLGVKNIYGMDYSEHAIKLMQERERERERGRDKDRKLEICREIDIEIEIKTEIKKDKEIETGNETSTEINGEKTIVESPMNKIGEEKGMMEIRYFEVWKTYDLIFHFHIDLLWFALYFHVYDVVLFCIVMFCYGLVCFVLFYFISPCLNPFLFLN